MNPGRFGYMRRILTEERGIDPQGKTALDVGCGGGLLAEEFAGLGCRVTGVDPSAESLRHRRAHAARQGLEIEYVEGTGSSCPSRTAPSTSSTAATCSSTSTTCSARSTRARGC